MAKAQLPLVPWLQCVVSCHQRTNIGEARKYWPCQSLRVFGQIIVIFCRYWKFCKQHLFYVFIPRGAFLLIFFRDSIGTYLANKAPERSERLRPFWSLRNKIASLGTLHSLIQNHSALCVGSLTLYSALKTPRVLSRIQRYHVYSAENLLDLKSRRFASLKLQHKLQNSADSKQTVVHARAFFGAISTTDIHEQI